ncbi:hypothetical protein KKE78_00440 [Patescibacteria group bacterium]|nr:hypothetical protein [Patescibacteria group bacterium]
MKKKTIIQFYNHYKLYIFPTAVVLSSLFLIIFAIYPQTAKLIENQKVAGEMQKKSNFLASNVIALEDVNSEDLSEKVGITLSAFPAEKDYGRILGLLQGLVVQSGFTISSVTLGNVSGKVGNASSYEVKLEVKGPKILFQGFINNLESSPRIIRVRSLDIVFVQASEILDTSVIIEVLYSPLPQTFKGDSPLPLFGQAEEELLISLSNLSKINLTASSSAAVYSQRGKVNPFE